MRITILCIILLFSGGLFAQTTVFQDDFNRGGVVSPLSNGGTPQMTWTTTSSLVTYPGTSSTNLNGSTGSDYSLIINGNATTPTAGYSWVYGSVSTFSSPYNSILNSNSGLLTWSFNMKTNRSTKLSGFGAANYGSAVILGATANTFSSSGTNGYAVIFKAGTTYNTVSLVRFVNGLNSNTTYTSIIGASSETSAMTNWVSVKVTYNPPTRQWALYWRDDASTTNPTDPMTGTLAQVGALTIDSTYAGTALPYCGFYWDHGGTSTPSSNRGFFDNFRAYCTSSAIAGLTGGIAATPINSTSTGKAIIGVSLTESINTASLTGLKFNTSSTNTDKFTNLQLWKSTDNDFSTTGDNTQITSGITITQNASDITVALSTALTLSTTATNLFLVADPVSSVNSSTASIQLTLPTSGVTVSTGTVTGSTVTGTNYTFVSPTDPALTVTGGPLSCGNAVTGTNSSPQTFTVAGSNLAGDISVSAPSLFQVSLSSGSGYSSSVTLTRSGNSVATTTIYAIFSPSAADGSHSGSITISTSGAASSTVSVSGNAISTEPTTASSSVAFATYTGTGVTVSWSLGNGNNHLVVARTYSVAAVVPTDGTSYTANAAFGSGNTTGTANYVVYSGSSNSVTVSTLAKGSFYSFDVYEFNGSGGSENYLTSASATAYTMAANDISSTGSGFWDVTTTWSTGAVPTSSDNVIILNGHTVTDTTSKTITVQCATLTVNSGGTFAIAQGSRNFVPSNIGSGNLSPVRIYGASVVNNGTLGTGTDGLYFQIYNATTPVKLSGANTIQVAKLNAGAVVPELKISTNLNTTYQASSTGSGSGLQITNTPNVFSTITIDAGATLTCGAYDNVMSTSSNGTDAPLSWTINVSGTINCSTANSGLQLRTDAGHTGNFNILSGGVVNAYGSFSPSGSYSLGIAGGVTNLTCNGTLNIYGTADFQAKQAQTLTGSGTFNLNSGGTLQLSSRYGLDPTQGPIRTSTRNYNAAANYLFKDTVETQVTGSDFPSTVNNLTVNSANGLTLTNPVTVNGALTFTGGNLNTGSNTLTLGSTGSISGETAAKYLVGTVQTTKPVSGSTAVDMGLGVSINPNSVDLGSTTFVKRLSGSGAAVTVSGFAGINRRWTITPSTQATGPVSVTLNWISADDNSNALTSAHVWKSDDNGGTWGDIAGPIDVSTSRSYTFSTSSFSDFTVSDELKPLPVELSSLSAAVSGRNISVNWITATEKNVSKFVVERSLNSSWSSVGEVSAYGNSNSPKSYSFIDKNLAVGKYSYRLKMIDNDGSIEYGSIMASAEVALPTEFKVSKNYPNPFNPSTKISYELPADAHIVIELYSITGQKIAELLNENASSGYYDYSINMAQFNLSSGLYLYKFTGRELTSGKELNYINKMIYMK